MSIEYDQYLKSHKDNVRKGFEWFKSNFPALFIDELGDFEWETLFAHDASKTNPDEYNAYDAYFYGNNKSYGVVKNFNMAWLLHIHRNPHHWQYWILNNDDPNEGEVVLDMPLNYIIEMICDWWSFSWKTGNLNEIFNWYGEHKDYIKLSPSTRNTVENILNKMESILAEDSQELEHHGIKGMRWGVRRTKEELAKYSRCAIIAKEAIESGNLPMKISVKDQNRHTKNGHKEGRSYLNGDLDFSQKLIDELHGTGQFVPDKNGNWTNKERVQASRKVGVHIDQISGKQTTTSKLMIVYSNEGTHIYPRKDG